MAFEDNHELSSVHMYLLYYLLKFYGYYKFLEKEKRQFCKNQSW